jgi:hypothetical protein
MVRDHSHAPLDTGQEEKCHGPLLEI